MRLLYLCLFFVCIRCTAQKQVTMEQKNIIIPEINSQFEKFDILNFQKNVDQISGKLIVNNKKFYLEQETQSSGFITRKYLTNSYFMLSKKFFENGKIKEKGIVFNNGYPIGKIYKFNEVGKLIETIDTDKGYKFSWKDIVKYCDKNKIPLPKGYKEFDGFQTSIFKNEIDSKKVWEITYQISGDEVLKLTLDGVTGEVLKQEKEEFINH